MASASSTSIPRYRTVLLLRDAANPAGIAQFGAVQAVAQSLGVELRPIDTRDAGEIERAIASFARAANGGLIVTPSASVSTLFLSGPIDQVRVGKSLTFDCLADRDRNHAMEHRPRCNKRMKLAVLAARVDGKRQATDEVTVETAARKC